MQLSCNELVPGMALSFGVQVAYARKGNQGHLRLGWAFAFPVGSQKAPAQSHLPLGLGWAQNLAPPKIQGWKAMVRNFQLIAPPPCPYGTVDTDVHDHIRICNTRLRLEPARFHHHPLTHSPPLLQSICSQTVQIHSRRLRWRKCTHS